RAGKVEGQGAGRRVDPRACVLLLLRRGTRRDGRRQRGFPAAHARSAAAGSLRLTAPAGRLPLGAIFGAIGLAATTAIGVLHLDHLGFTVCLFKAFTGWPCPTCGSTRALGRLFALDLPGALAMNPLVAVGALAL